MAFVIIVLFMPKGKFWFVEASPWAAFTTTWKSFY